MIRRPGRHVATRKKSESIFPVPRGVGALLSTIEHRCHNLFRWHPIQAGNYSRRKSPTLSPAQLEGCRSFRAMVQHRAVDDYQATLKIRNAQHDVLIRARLVSDRGHQRVDHSLRCVFVPGYKTQRGLVLSSQRLALVDGWSVDVCHGGG